MKYLSVSALLVVGLFFPTLSLAQGLVPVQCTGPDAAVSCGTCEFVDLINNVIQFIITFATILATIAIIYAGFRLVISAGDVSAKEVAKRIIVNVLIGYVLILAAFLIVNTILGVLVSDGDEFGILSWQEVECIRPIGPSLTINRDPELTPLDLLEEITGWERGVYTSSDLPASRCHSVDECAADVAECTSLGLEADYDGQIPGLVECDMPVGGTSSGAGACSDQYIQSWGSQAANARCIAQEESVCGARPISTSDIASDGTAFSLGVYQINTTVHQVRNCPGYPTLDCPSAWSGTDYAARIADQNLYQACRRALLDVRCNTITAQRVYRERNSWAAWSTAGACGL